MGGIELTDTQFCPFNQRIWMALEERNISYQYHEVNVSNAVVSILLGIYIIADMAAVREKRGIPQGKPSRPRAGDRGGQVQAILV